VVSGTATGTSATSGTAGGEVLKWPNRLIGMNLRRARYLRGLNQAEAAELLEPYLGVRWSSSTFSLAETSLSGRRVRDFSADEVAAFSKAFRLPVVFFYLPVSADEADGRVPTVEDLDVALANLEAVEVRLVELFTAHPELGAEYRAILEQREQAGETAREALQSVTRKVSDE
jgi:transcriptional regulator with XRE-family HTH domain